MTNDMYGGLATDFLHQFSAFWARACLGNRLDGVDHPVVEHISGNSVNGGSDATGRQTQLDTADEIQHVLKKFPELRKLHVKDYIKFIDATGIRCCSPETLLRQNTLLRRSTD